MIYLIHNTCCKADLVTVGGISCRSTGYDLTLRELTLDGLAHRLQRICRSGYSHCRINVGAAGQGVSYCAADTGCGAAEGLDLCGVVMCFVLEEEEPFLRSSVYLYIYLYRAGIDLLRFIKLIELALLFEITNCKGSNVHKANRLCSAKLLTGIDILLVCLLDEGILKGDAVNSCEKRCVTAMVRPVCIYHTDLGDGGVSLFGNEVFLTEGDIIKIHCKTV